MGSLGGASTFANVPPSPSSYQTNLKDYDRVSGRPAQPDCPGQSSPQSVEMLDRGPL